MRRAVVAFGIATVCAWLAALVHVGLLRLQLSAEAKVAFVIGGGVIAACVRGRTRLARRLYAMPFLLYSGLLVLSTSLYARGRTSVLTVELLVPAAVSAVPFGLAYRATGRTIARTSGNQEV